jgi:hypothetical protein
VSVNKVRSRPLGFALADARRDTSDATILRAAQHAATNIVALTRARERFAPAAGEIAVPRWFG